MFSKDITNSSEFLMMSQSAQNLYFHFGMNADDDGFCEVFTVMRMTDSKPDDLRALHERAFIYIVDSKVCIVKDWHENNQLRSDRYKPSKYLEDPKYKDIYTTIMEDKIKEIDQYKTLLLGGLPNGNQMEPQYSIGEYSIGNEIQEVKISEDSQKEKKSHKSNSGGFPIFWEGYPRKEDKTSAFAEWGKLSPEKKQAALMDIPQRSRSEAWTKDGGKFIPLAKTYLKNERWMDEFPVQEKIMSFGKNK